MARHQPDYAAANREDRQRKLLDDAPGIPNSAFRIPHSPRAAIETDLARTIAWAEERIGRAQKLVVASGVFDGLVPKDVIALEQARAAGDALLVIVLPTWGTVSYTPSARALRVASLKSVDHVHLCTCDDQALAQVLDQLPPALFALTEPPPKSLHDWLHRRGWEPLDVWRSAHAAAAEYSWATE